MSAQRDDVIGFVGELVGTAIFAFGLVASAVPGLADRVDTYVALSLFLGIICVYRLCDAHLNAAVTLGFFVQDRNFSGQKLGLYILGQTIGAFVGGVLAYLLTGYSAAPEKTDVDFQEGLLALGGEVVGTFSFVTIILHVVAFNNTLSEVYKFITIAAGLYFSRYFSIPTSGGVLNPSIYVGLNLVQLIHGSANDVSQGFGGFYLYLLGPLIGGALAGFYFQRGQQIVAYKQVSQTTTTTHQHQVR